MIRGAQSRSSPRWDAPASYSASPSITWAPATPRRDRDDRGRRAFVRYDAVLAETVAIQGADIDEIEAYVARPMDRGSRGCVLVIHHMPGYDRETKEITRGSPSWATTPSARALQSRGIRCGARRRRSHRSGTGRGCQTRDSPATPGARSVPHIPGRRRRSPRRERRAGATSAAAYAWNMAPANLGAGETEYRLEVCGGLEVFHDQFDVSNPRHRFAPQSCCGVVAGCGPGHHDLLSVDGEE